VAKAFLVQAIGVASPVVDANLADALAQVEAQPSRLPAHRLVDTAAEVRLRASFGQSVHDWLRLRFGVLGRVSDGVAWPEHAGEVRELLDWARAHGVRVQPCGGATSVVGHLTPVGAAPILVLKLGRMMRLLELDPVSRLARFEAGVAGPLEAQLRAHGFTLGHFPQSFSTDARRLIATRSSGQQSARYGRIEQLYAGATLLRPRANGPPALPASAAGPDLREWVLGSEGRIGVITEATVRVSPQPEREHFVGVFFADWPARAVRELVRRARHRCCAWRAPRDADDAGDGRPRRGHRCAERMLAWRGVGAGKCLLLAGFSGAAEVDAMRRARRASGVASASRPARCSAPWAARRFAGVYLRNGLWDAGYAVETMETACDWSRVDAMIAAIEGAGRAALARDGERVHAYTHLSHVYAQGSSVYSTFVYRIGADYETALARWHGLKDAVSDAIVAEGGTISHQHGVGHDHRRWLGAEKGAVGIAALQAMVAHFDPHGVMAGGHLIAGDEPPVRRRR
jgi:alkyldihydroxyacetonephosphate synthase